MLEGRLGAAWDALHACVQGRVQWQRSSLGGALRCRDAGGDVERQGGQSGRILSAVPVEHLRGDVHMVQQLLVLRAELQRAQDAGVQRPLEEVWQQHACQHRHSQRLGDALSIQLVNVHCGVADKGGCPSRVSLRATRQSAEIEAPLLSKAHLCSPVCSPTSLAVLLPERDEAVPLGCRSASACNAECRRLLLERGRAWPHAWR